MEFHLPHLDSCVRTSSRQLALRTSVGHPEHGIDASRDSVLDRYVLHGLPDAPHIYVGVQRARGTVERVRGPAERVHACRVEGPTRGDQFALRHVVQDDFPTRLREKKRKKKKDNKVRQPTR